MTMLSSESESEPGGGPSGMTISSSGGVFSDQPKYIRTYQHSCSPLSSSSESSSSGGKAGIIILNISLHTLTSAIHPLTSFSIGHPWWRYAKGIQNCIVINTPLRISKSAFLIEDRTSSFILWGLGGRCRGSLLVHQVPVLRVS